MPQLKSNCCHKEKIKQTKMWSNQVQQTNFFSPLYQKTSSVLISSGKCQWTYMQATNPLTVQCFHWITVLCQSLTSLTNICCISVLCFKKWMLWPLEKECSLCFEFWKKIGIIKTIFKYGSHWCQICNSFLFFSFHCLKIHTSVQGWG